MIVRGSLSKLCPFCGLSRQSAFCVASCKDALEKYDNPATKKKVTGQAALKPVVTKKAAVKPVATTKASPKPAVAKKAVPKPAAGKKKMAAKKETPVSQMGLDAMKAYLVSKRIPRGGLSTKADFAKIVSAHRTGGLAAASSAMKRLQLQKRKKK
jgi:uncharacterized protein YkwD